MAVEIKLPALGEGVDSGDVLEIFVSVGDTVEKNEALVELETDKATVNVPAEICLLYTSPSPRDRTRSRMPSSA